MRNLVKRMHWTRWSGDGDDCCLVLMRQLNDDDDAVDSGGDGVD